jgi:MFS family permease
MYCYDSAFIGTTLALHLSNTASASTTSPKASFSISSNTVFTAQAGTFSGTILGVSLAERWGRKITIMGGRALFMVGTGSMLRGVNGLTIGATSIMMPIYVAECSPALFRGRLVGIFETMLQRARLRLLGQSRRRKHLRFPR